MTTTTTTLETLASTIDYWTALRTSLRNEARTTVDRQSREDRTAECNRITARLTKLYASMDALTGE